MLTADQIAKLARIARYSTKYEVIVEHPTDPRRMRLPYIGSTGQRALVQSVRAIGQKVCDTLDLSPSDLMTGHGSGRNATLSLGGWTVRFSGRTQREAIIGGELPSVESVWITCGRRIVVSTVDNPTG